MAILPRLLTLRVANTSETISKSGQSTISRSALSAQAGLDAHFRAVAAASSLPLMIYDIPVRTGRKVAHDTLLRLIREVPTVVAVKDAAGDPAGSARLVAEAPGDFDLYCGDDGLTLPLAAVGGAGIVGVATHWAGEIFGDMLGAFWKGDVETAQVLNARLIESYGFETGDAAPNPIPTKAMLSVLGLPGGQCRLPLGPPPPGLDDRAREVLDRLQGVGSGPAGSGAGSKRTGGRRAGDTVG